MGISLRFFGTNTLLVKTEDTDILVDPHFTRPSRRAMLGKIAPDYQKIRLAMTHHSIDRVDAVLITHSHYDHAIDAAEVAKQNQAVVYGSVSMGRIIKASDLPETQFKMLQPGGTYQIGSIKVTSLPADHLNFPGPFDAWMRLNEEIEKPLSPPAWFWQYRAGQVFAFLLEINDTRLLLNGSAGLFTSPPNFSADVAVLCIGGIGWKSSASIREWFRQMVLDTSIRQLFLAHYDDFTKPLGHPLPWIPGTRRAVRLISQLAEETPGLSAQVLPYLTDISVAV